MAAVRVAVEWGFGKVVELFQYLNHEENLRLFLQPVRSKSAFSLAEALHLQLTCALLCD